MRDVFVVLKGHNVHKCVFTQEDRKAFRARVLFHSACEAAAALLAAPLTWHVSPTTATLQTPLERVVRAFEQLLAACSSLTAHLLFVNCVLCNKRL